MIQFIMDSLDRFWPPDVVRSSEDDDGDDDGEEGKA